MVLLVIDFVLHASLFDTTFLFSCRIAFFSLPALTVIGFDVSFFLSGYD
jgi:hypothetical protein